MRHVAAVEHAALADVKEPRVVLILVP
jgi:hypothetical protein